MSTEYRPHSNLPPNFSRVYYAAMVTFSLYTLEMYLRPFDQNMNPSPRVEEEIKVIMKDNDLPLLETIRDEYVRGEHEHRGFMIVEYTLTSALDGILAYWVDNRIYIDEEPDQQRI